MEKPVNVTTPWFLLTTVFSETPYSDGDNTSLYRRGNDTVGLDDATPHLPREMLFNDESLMSVVAYSVLFCVAGLGNLTVFITLFRNRNRRSRVNLFIMHLSIADLLVTFVMMPLEIGWHLTVSWNAGDVACRVLMFFRAFGFYLSSFILAAISLDRYFAIAHPLNLNDADKRGKLMLTMAWLFSIVASIPQSVIFHVETHPVFEWFSQCVTFNFFPTRRHELAYNLFNIVAVYLAPLVVILISYSLILWEITKKTREGREQLSTSDTKRKKPMSDFRRSGMGRIQKARSRTLKMTIVIVSVFIVCWTPYFVMSALWWFDQKAASKIHPKVQKGLFLFAVSNSCMDPIVYGLFVIDFMREFRRCCLCFRARSPPPSNAYLGIGRSGTGGMGTVTSRCGGCSAQANLHTGAGVATCGLHRQVTPPYIAQGRGNKDHFDRYMML